VESDNIYVSEYGNLVILQVGFDHFSSSYRCTITIDSLKEGYQTKQGRVYSRVYISSYNLHLYSLIWACRTRAKH